MAFGSVEGKNSQFEDMELSDIFTDGDTQVIYEGEIIETGAMIHAEKWNPMPLTVFLSS